MYNCSLKSGVKVVSCQVTKIFIDASGVFTLISVGVSM